MLSRFKLQRWPCIVICFIQNTNKLNKYETPCLDVLPYHIWKQQLHKATTDTVTGQLR